MPWNLPLPALPGRGRPRRWSTYNHHTLPQVSYTQVRTIPLNRQAQGIVSGGTVTVSLGPSGVGSKWYPMTAVFTTTTGPTDGSTAVMYNNFVSINTQMNGQGYAGGGDTAGLAIPMMTPGDLIVVQWTRAHNGDVATVTIVGTQDLLSYD